ncbi:hypothetical protein B0J13DRAFT_333461 [Dactylonectria estremocensis]|uniref:Uncharacterized protein n=1 Tax=Dactylonectria estremocensis TaxID=1079267 RepID=A0A9P9I6M6_9HYPO|nr:hypothetical protein B0J13DRAFT_333461 [Dactylonectria estremocensis]
MTVAQEGFLTSFPSNFLAHLPGVEYLRLAGNHDAVIGHYESGNPIPWAAVQIPQLRFFELEYSYLDEGLANFLVNHQNTLEKIYLRRCLAEEKSNWRELFRRVLEKNPRQLVEFTVLAYPVRKRTIYATHEEWNIAQHELEEAMRDDPEEDVEDERNRKFVVAKTCESYGAIEPKELYHDPEDDEDDESNPLDESDIVKEWDELQKLVKRNRDAARLSR